ncbi:ankyrin repeat and MYND domain-containing protein 2-like isoform X3 [Xenopus laevis]|uniref:Ankyrin repeat and MYND domain-containing protein 2-like isoform X3 n=1 Tax=Xenopus laevis TaxID=8355 RepID=A0A8J1L038_XENLA|nr:ankyrin repeat and MYND domain-containing protein 2-like isoform X3 [Xenopus laevis]
MAPRKGELTEDERQLLTHISQGNIQETRRLLGSKDVRVNCLDELSDSALAVLGTCCELQLLPIRILCFEKGLQQL